LPAWLKVYPAGKEQLSDGAAARMNGRLPAGRAIGRKRASSRRKKEEGDHPIILKIAMTDTIGYGKQRMLDQKAQQRTEVGEKKKHIALPPLR